MAVLTIRPISSVADPVVIRWLFMPAVPPARVCVDGGLGRSPVGLSSVYTQTTPPCGVVVVGLSSVYTATPPRGGVVCVLCARGGGVDRLGPGFVGGRVTATLVFSAPVARPVRGAGGQSALRSGLRCWWASRRSLPLWGLVARALGWFLFRTRVRRGVWGRRRSAFWMLDRGAVGGGPSRLVRGCPGLAG